MRVAKAAQGSTSQQESPGVTSRPFMAVAASSADTSSLRTETWNEREYTVVPVVAIVEGVLFGANASSPEFAPASEFGKFPQGWNGRPVVLNHPQVAGLYVSAANPAVWEQNTIGYMFNTYLDGTKLKTEAWLDGARIAELGGIFQATFERILNGDLVEVSVGAFIETLNSSGTFNGQSYAGVWSNVVPDHLAFLEEGLVGACSVADGCGVPRLNAVNTGSLGNNREGLVTTQIDRTGFVIYTAEPKAAKVGEGAAGNNACCQSCAEGSPCEGKASNMPQANSAPANDSPLTDEQIQLLRTERRAEAFEHITVEAVSPDVDLGDVRQAVYMALQQHLNVSTYDLEVAALTTEQVAYYIWLNTPRYAYFALSYSIDALGHVEFTGEPKPVNVVTRIVPRNSSASGAVSGSLNTNERNEGMPGENGQDQNGSEVMGQDGQTAAGAGGSAAPEGTGVSTNQQAPQPAKVKTFAELLTEAPADVRDQWEYGMQAYTARKTDLVAGIKALQNNPYSDDQLQAMTVKELESLAKLANVPTYQGRAVPSGEDQTQVSTNTAKPQFVAAERNFLGAKE